MIRGRNRLADSILFVQSVETKTLVLRVYMINLMSSNLPLIQYFKMQD